MAANNDSSNQNEHSHSLKNDRRSMRRRNVMKYKKLPKRLWPGEIYRRLRQQKAQKRIFRIIGQFPIIPCSYQNMQ